MFIEHAIRHRSQSGKDTGIIPVSFIADRYAFPVNHQVDGDNVGDLNPTLAQVWNSVEIEHDMCALFQQVSAQTVQVEYGGKPAPLR